MKSKICFITPPSLFLLDERVFPSLGVLSVAAVAEQQGYGIEHLDLNGVTNYEQVVEQYCNDHDTNVFAITATTPQMVAVTKIRKVIEKVRPQSKTILGGPHVTLVHAAAMNTASTRAIEALDMLKDYNVSVAGDGEHAIAYAIEHDGGLINADDPKGSMFLTSKEFAALPLPARHLVDLNTYKYEIDGVRTTSIITQLGCPFGCLFCAGRDSAMLRRVRLRPVHNVMQEILHVYARYGMRGFMFLDDELNVNTQFVELLKEMVKAQERHGVEFRCRGFVKAELFTDEQAEWMYRAGFRNVLCGFESGSDRILRNINKHATKDDNTRVVEKCAKYGLKIKALMSLGHPGESHDTVSETIAWLMKVKPHDFDCTIITAYPGSPYYDHAKRRGEWTWVFTTRDGERLYMQDIDYTQVEDFYKGAWDGYKSYVWTDYLLQDALVDARNFVESSVRDTLRIPYYAAGSTRTFDASMGQLPGSVYRKAVVG